LGAAADGVVEHHDAAGAGGLFHQVFGFLVVDRLELGLVIEVGDGGGGRDEGETLGVEGQVSAIGRISNTGMVWGSLTMLVFGVPSGGS